MVKKNSLISFEIKLPEIPGPDGREDNDVAKYYDDLLGTYQARYTLFTSVLAVLAAIAIVVPLIAGSMK